MTPLFECVPNFSEGRDGAVIDALEHAIAATPGVAVLDRTSDADHNRSVITFAGSRIAVVEGALNAALVARDRIDLTGHRGVHPRLGALDVLPFVPLEGATLNDCVDLARLAGRRIWQELKVPIYYYAAAATHPQRIRLEDVRRGEFELLCEQATLDPTKAPDVGGPALHPTAGATIVGARKILIAFNINLKSGNLALAKKIARTIRTSSGGLPAVKALGLALASKNCVQISMNLTDFEQTPPHVVFEAVRRLAADEGVEIEESELIGLAPQKALRPDFIHALKLPFFSSHCLIETRLKQRLAKVPLS